MGGLQRCLVKEDLAATGEVCSDASLKNVLAAKGIAVGESPGLLTGRSDEAEIVDLGKSGCKGSMQWDCIKGSDAGKS